MTSALRGKRILVTRPRHQAEEFLLALSNLGAIPILAPAVEIGPPDNGEQFDEALKRLSQFNWLVLTSVNGVMQFANRMQALGLRLIECPDLKIAVIGPATGHALQELGREPDCMPTTYISEAIADALGDIVGARVLLARANLTRPELATLLRDRGALVREVAAYNIVPIGMTLNGPAPDYLTLTSAAIARHTIAMLTEGGMEEWLSTTRIACIGPITSRAVEDAGYKVSVSATEYTIPGLIGALCADAEREVRAHV